MKWSDGLSLARRYGWKLLGAAAVVVLLALAGPRVVLGPQVAVETVVQRDFVQSVVASGRVETPHRVDVGVQITGTVAHVPVAEGQAVNAGDVLIELESAELRAAAQQADVAVAQAQVRLRQLREVQAPIAEQAVRQAQANLDNARQQLARNRDLFAKGFIGQAALDEGQRNVEVADAQLRTTQKQLESARPAGSDFAAAEAALAQARASAEAAHARLQYASVRAPLAGTLISRSVERGAVVQPGKALMVLSPAGETQLVVQIDEKNLYLLQLGQQALASADAYAQQRFGAELVYINPGVDAQRGSVEVKLKVPAPPPYLRQDMTVSVDIEVARRPAAVLVPSDAVREPDSKAPWVLVVDGGHARRRAVRLGLRSAGLSEVIDGLRPGEQVVSAAAALQDGARLRAMGASSPR
jgi:HlyD family secretion protein